ncbi:MAG: hypothetical protein ACYDAG_02505 [Chloroflexota bacterium]
MMTVGQLVEALLEFPLDTPVVTNDYAGADYKDNDPRPALVFRRDDAGEIVTLN